MDTDTVLQYTKDILHYFLTTLLRHRLSGHYEILHLLYLLLWPRLVTGGQIQTALEYTRNNKMCIDQTLGQT